MNYLYFSFWSCQNFCPLLHMPDFFISGDPPLIGIYFISQFFTFTNSYAKLRKLQALKKHVQLYAAKMSSQF